MATCNPNTILASGKAFQGLSAEGLRLSCLASLATILVNASPGTDVTPAAILSRGKTYQGLDTQGIRNVIYQALCTINGG